ncbi:COX assembly mitochondrial protein 2 homolog [Onthophagus taurus]|uniref:COX assembly mitochondrial protein 2 homolog n=1 Tax=Onthophagus taurus TaxID=166361 RepID=UPI000C2069FB|nr:COX assembly mitochondrial protein 2 homolog [Onthophagus taurus]
MHTDLSPHLHTEECQKLIFALINCHKENPFLKFVGVCNEQDSEMLKCLKAERKQRQKENLRKTRERLKRLHQKEL